MNTKELALAKMLEETSKPHAKIIDTLHNLLCVCDDEEVYTGLLKEGKTLNGAYLVMLEYARKNQQAGSYGMDDTLALQLVKDYLNETKTTPDVESPKNEQKDSSYKLPKNVTGVGVVDAPKPKKAKEAKEDVNMNIFDFLGEEPNDESEDPED